VIDRSMGAGIALESALERPDRLNALVLVGIAETDHVVNMRRPAEFSRVVLDFLRETQV
jgi:pimeloyl-ACP methyl ester carboxylesterase